MNAPPAVRTFHHAEFRPAELVAAKGGQLVTVCLPAHNEAATVGAIVEAIRTDLVEAVPLVDEVLVIDDRSTDGTAEVAAAAGARVEAAVDLLPGAGVGHGKGEVMWKSLAAAKGDVVVWCDADIREFGSHFVTGVLGPLLTHPELAFVKGFYERPINGHLGGGRVTELVARPLLSLYFPELATVVQPLSGEYGGRREALEQVPFAQGYGVDVGLLIDLDRLVGPARLAQVDLDVRHHRNRPLDELSAQAQAVAQAILARAGVAPRTGTLLRPGCEPTPIDVTDRPPLRGLLGELG